MPTSSREDFVNGLLSHHTAAVDRDDVAGHPRCALGSQIGHELGDLRRLAGAPERVRFAVGVEVLVVLLLALLQNPAIW